MSDQLPILAVLASTTVTPECDCYVHRFGSIAPGQRARCYPSGMTDAEWAEVRSAMPVPALLLQQGGRPVTAERRRLGERSGTRRAEVRPRGEDRGDREGSAGQ